MRLLHTMLRVGDLDRSIAFYTDSLGMQLLRRRDFPQGRFTLAFLGYGPETEHTVLELTHNWDTASYELGTAYGHVAIGVDDVHATCAQIKAKGGKVVREPGRCSTAPRCSPSSKIPMAIASSCCPPTANRHRLRAVACRPWRAAS